MIVAVLDLLGFSSLLQENPETALDNVNAVNDAIKVRMEEHLRICNSHISEQEADSYAKKWALMSCDQIISFSDSLVLGGNNADSVVSELANFVASMYINRSKPFKEEINDINNITTNQNVDVVGNGKFRYHQAAPVLFRGGVSVGNQICFFDGYGIKNEKICHSSNVTGKTYLNAVKLERAGKGPRLFCDRSVVDAISDKNVKIMIKKVKGLTDIFEIVWTMEGCSISKGSSDKWDNICESINTTMLPPAINLYRYYREDKDLKEHYEQLLKLVCCGIVKYADFIGNKITSKAINLMNEKLQEIPIIDNSVLEGFLD